MPVYAPVHELYSVLQASKRHENFNIRATTALISDRSSFIASRLAWSIHATQ